MNANGSARPVQILLVEDNEADVEMVRICLRQGRLANSLQVATDGETALACLYQQPPYENTHRPDLVLLDLNLPRLGGLEVLRRMRGDPALSSIPVVVLTTSGAEQDIEEAYGLHASSFVRKPVAFDEFLSVVRELTRYWFQVVELPRSGLPAEPHWDVGPQT